MPALTFALGAYLERQHGHFVRDALLDWQPVQFLQQRVHV